MKNKLRFLFAVCALTLAPALFAQPFTYTTPYGTDTVYLNRTNPDGTQAKPTFTLLQIVNFLQSQTTAGFITNPTQVLGYGAGSASNVTQATNKSTGVTLNYTNGQITMNNASLANGAVVKFTVTDSAVLANDVIVISPQQASITAAAAYLITANANAGSFVVNVYNAGTTESDAIVLNFAIVRTSTN